MKSNLLIAALLGLAASTAVANSYVVTSDKGTSNEPRLAAKHNTGNCVYADRVVNLGDTVIMQDQEIVLVCASAPQGAVFYPLSSAGAERAIQALPANAR